MTWRTARSLDVLLGEINDRAPGRSKVSDGSIGDAAHASRDSDHNPWIMVAGIGVVRARDFTHDPAGGLDCNDLAAALVELYGEHPAMGSGAYTIWNEHIYSYDRRAEGWRWYGNWSTGRNPHDHHLHQSVATAAAGFDSTQRWGVLAPPAPKGLTMDQDVKAAFGRLQEQLDDVREALGVLRQKEGQRFKKAISELRGQGKTDRQILDALEGGD